MLYDDKVVEDLREAGKEVLVKLALGRPDVVREVGVAEEFEVPLHQHAPAPRRARLGRWVEADLAGFKLSPGGAGDLGEFVEKVLLRRFGPCGSSVRPRDLIAEGQQHLGEGPAVLRVVGPE